EPTRPLPEAGKLTLGELLKYKSEEGVRFENSEYDTKWTSLLEVHRFDVYRPVRAVPTGPPVDRYTERAVPSIEAVSAPLPPEIDRCISRGREKEEEGEKYLESHVLLFPGSPTLSVARGQFLRWRAIRGEKERGDALGPRIASLECLLQSLIITFYIMGHLDKTKECNFDLYRLVRAICTGPSGYRYVDHPLPGGIAKINRRWSISVVGCRLREKSTDRRQSTEGEIN
ncbi:hypothetical protein GW17_00024247, partial [Ensete ventricosum]